MRNYRDDLFSCRRSALGSLDKESNSCEGTSLQICAYYELPRGEDLLLRRIGRPVNTEDLH
jgi:hypothetical protein